MRAQDKSSRAVTAATLCTLALACARSGFDEVLLEQGDPVPWHDVGGEPAAARQVGILGWSQAPVALALDLEGRPVVAYDDGTAIGVRRWTGTNWWDLGSPGTGVRVTLALDRDDRPWVAWDAGGAPATLRVALWDGQSWQHQPSIPTGTTVPSAAFLWPALAFDSEARAVVAVGSSSSGDVNCVHRFDGAIWQLLSPSEFVCLRGDENRPGFAAGPAGTLLLSDTTELGTWVREWGAGAWSPATTVVTEHSSVWTAVVQTARGPTVASAPRFHLAVHQRRDGVWVALGDFSGDDTARVGSPGSPALAVDPAGEPITAWASSGTPYVGAAIYVRAWDGSAWHSLLAEEQAPIYIGTIIGVRPALAADDAQVCVAFTAGSDTEFDVHVRCATPRW